MNILKPSRLLAALCAGLIAAGSHAQSFPDKPITWVVPFAAGGPTDALARDIAQRTSAQLNQQIVILNQPGAGGTIGAARVARATPDGYTMLVGHMGYMGAAPSLYKSLAYDPVKDFDPVFRFPDTPLVLLVGKDSPYDTVEKLIAYSKQHPGRLDFGNAGVGSTSHLVAALFASQAGIDVSSVPYRGAGPALTDLMGGQLSAMFDQTNTALPQLEGGRLKAIGLTSARPMAQFPGVPALGERALPGFEAATWYGIYAPKGTPAAAIKMVHEAYRKALADKGWTDKMASQGIQLLAPGLDTPEALARHTASEVERWRHVAKSAGIALD